MKEMIDLKDGIMVNACCIELMDIVEESVSTRPGITLHLKIGDRWQAKVITFETKEERDKMAREIKEKILQCN